MKKKEMPYKASTLVADKSFAEMMKKTKGIPPCIEPGSLDGIDMKVVSLEEPVFQFREIRPRKKNIDFNKLQEVYDKMKAEDVTIQIPEENMYEASYKLGLNKGINQGIEQGRLEGAKNVLEYLIKRVQGIRKTDIRKQQLDDESKYAYDFTVTLLTGELNKFKSYGKGGKIDG